MSSKKLFILFTILLIITLASISLYTSSTIEKRLNQQLTQLYIKEEQILSLNIAKIIKEDITVLENELKIIGKNTQVKEGSASACNNTLKDSFEITQKHIGNLGRVDKNGVFKCSLNPALIGTKAENLGAYITTIFNDPEHKPVMSRAIKPAGSDSYLVALHIPIFNSKNEFDGTLGGAIYLNNIYDKTLKNVALSEGGFVSLIDDDSTVLYHPRTEFINKKASDPELQKQLTPHTAFSDIVDTALKDGEGTMYYALNDEKRIASFATVEVIPGRKWIVSVVLPTKDIDNFIGSTGVTSIIKENLAIKLAFIILASTSYMFILNKRIFNPLEDISVAAEKIGKGNLDIKLKYNRNDEIGILSHNFNQMTENLKDLYQNLENKVALRTQELNTEKHKIETILEGIGDAVFAIDNDKKIIVFNKVAEELSGYSRTEALGKLYTEILKFKEEKAIDSKELEHEFIDLAMLGQKAEMGRNTQLIRKDGRVIPVADSAAPIVDTDEKVNGVVVVFRDVSKERALEKSKDEFVSIASHELRTPLGIIKSYISMILTGDYGKVTKNLQEPLTDIKTSTERLIRLVNDMLDVARIEAGRITLDLKDFEISKPIEELVNNIQPFAKEKNLEVKTNKDFEIFKNKHIKVQADIDKVKQLLNNLVGNALKFTTEGSITISAQEKGQWIEILITDTGHGITPEDQTKLFGKFQQLGFEGSYKPEGTGLGLYISKQIALKMGGDLYLKESIKDKGTVFAFTLPTAGTQIANKTKDKLV